MWLVGKMLHVRWARTFSVQLNTTPLSQCSSLKASFSFEFKFYIIYINAEQTSWPLVPGNLFQTHGLLHFMVYYNLQWFTDWFDVKVNMQ